MTLIKTRWGSVNLMEYGSDSDKTVFCIHGFCCDARIFGYLGESLSCYRLKIYSLDLFGHGGSDGEPGDPDFDACLDAIHEVIGSLRGNSKVFLLGHSMGCTYVMWYAKKFPSSVDGIILMSPYVRIRGIKRSEIEPSPLRFLYYFIRSLFTPKTKVDVTKALPNYLRVGGAKIKQMLKDPYLNFWYSYRYIVNVLALKNDKARELSKIRLPVYIMHGRNDQNVYSEVSRKFYGMLSTDKKISFFDCDHWFFDSVFYSQDGAQEEDRQKIILAISAWLEKF